MSLTTTTSLFQYAIAALGQAYTPPCAVQTTSDFTVTYTNSTTLVDRVLVLNVDYFVTGAAVAGVIASPTITLEGTGLHYATGGILTIQRKPTRTQPTNFTDGNKYLASTTNNALDWLAYQVQALYDIAQRCLQVPATSPAQTPVQLNTRKGQLAGWDAAGNFCTYSAGGLASQPFPLSLFPSNPIFLPGVTAHIGGTFNSLDGLDITAITTTILVILSIGDNNEMWKLRSAQGGDLAISDGVSVVVPVVNPANLRWIRTA